MTIQFIQSMSITLHMASSMRSLSQYRVKKRKKTKKIKKVFFE